MSDYYKEKELRAVIGKIKTTKKESGFFVKNIWKVIGFGVFFSFWGPTYVGGDYLVGHKSALDLTNMGYYGLVILTACLYTFCSFLAHFIWGYQAKRKIKRLEKRKFELEKHLGLKK